MRVFSLILLLSLWLYAQQSVYNGQVLVAKFGPNVQSVTRGDETVQLFSLPGSQKQAAILPVDYKTKKASLTLKVHTAKSTTQQRFAIRQKDYPKEQLQVAPKKVSPPKEAMERIKKEYRQAMNVYNTSTPKLYFDSRFTSPLRSKITSEFGSARVYNGSLEGFHGGTDFRAARGTKVSAANSGVVVIAKDRYYAGKSVVIDHGYGIYSTYYHLSDIAVQKGQKVQKGQLLGSSGKSGRVTGPHLHFGIKVGGKSVDPLDFIQKINAAL
ncbi:MAG: M23 family metallopeptidase [Campylobacterota bacterium]